MPSGAILAVDDDKNILELIKIGLEHSSYRVTTAPHEEMAKKAMLEQTFDLAIIDLQLVNQDGISLMEEFHHINPEMPVIILTAHGSIESAVDAMQRGAFNYLTKPFDFRELILQIERALENKRLTSEVKRLKGLVKEQYDFANIIARSENMRKVLEKVSRIAKTDSTIYLYGESGTGKELIARAIHLVSERRDRAFIAINCAAIPETLLESELFGYEKGAFTGAEKNKDGLFRQAHEGTIFLDEIGDMSLPLQAKLLRVLQERQFYPLGSKNSVTVDVRVVCATNKHLEDEVKKGEFREDLYYRIHVIPVEIPPLRERKEDIPLLVEHFLKKLKKIMHKNLKGFTPQAMQKLMMYEWPGNVRELENTVEYAAVMAQEEMIKEDLILNTNEDSVETLKPLKEARDSFEKEYLTKLLRFTGGNVSKAAKLADRYRADFYNILKKHEINPKDFKNPA